MLHKAEYLKVYCTDVGQSSFTVQRKTCTPISTVPRGSNVVPYRVACYHPYKQKTSHDQKVPEKPSGPARLNLRLESRRWHLRVPPLAMLPVFGLQQQPCKRESPQ